jgi:hypothetical protein
MLSRWDEWYSSKNLSSDERLLAAPASKSAELAAVEFKLRGKKPILDLACGVDRDTFHLKASGLLENVQENGKWANQNLSFFSN